jgi:RNA polymerase sigma-70 factor (ECF subfamily)
VEVASDYSIDLGLRRPAHDVEAALVARAAAGDGEAYADLVRPHERVAYRVAVAITGWGADAQEAVQNAHVKAYRSLGRFRRGAAFRPWLLRIVVNEAHNVRRSERRHRRLAVRASQWHEPAKASADEAVAAREEAETVLSGLEQLSDADRLVLGLRYFAQLPDGEAAQLAGTTPGTYRVRLLRARHRLREVLEDLDD